MTGKKICRLRENRVWRTYLGGARIDGFYGRPESADGSFPEDWTASAVKAFNPGREHLTEGLGCTEDGQRVCDRIGQDTLPILVKLLDAAERLVIQAHPTVDFARSYLNSAFGKAESWYFLDCAPEACVYFGFKKGVTRAAWEDVFTRQDIGAMLAMLHRLPVKKGDFLFVDGGIPHAICGGSFMIELQEPSDLMVIPERRTPSGRVLTEAKMHMGLGFSRMFDVFDYTGYEESELLRKYSPVSREISAGVRMILDKDTTDKFSMAELSDGALYERRRKYAVAVVTGGCGEINGMRTHRGDRLFLTEDASAAVSGDSGFRVILCE